MMVSPSTFIVPETGSVDAEKRALVCNIIGLNNKPRAKQQKGKSDLGT